MGSAKKGHRDRARSVSSSRIPGLKLIADAIETGMARLAEHGIGIETCLFGPDGSDDAAGVVAGAVSVESVS
jgi:hypothetical protein